MSGRTRVFLLIAVLFFATLAGVIATRRRQSPPPPPVASPPATPRTESPETALPQPVEISTTPELVDGALVVEAEDEKGAPVAGARITDCRNDSATAGTTDGRGRSVIPFEKLIYGGTFDLAILRVDHPFHAPALAHVPPRVPRVRVILGISAGLQVIVESETGRPIPGAEIKVGEVERGGLASGWHRAWTTGEDGSVRLTGIPPGSIVIRATADGYEEGRRLAIVAATEVRIIRMRLTRGKRIKVTVLAPDGEPVPDAIVEVEIPSGDAPSAFADRFRTSSWKRRTDSKGVADFQSIPAATLKAYIAAKAPAFPRQYKEVALAVAETEVDLTFQPAATLVVDLLDSAGNSLACTVSVLGLRIPGQDKPAGAKAKFEGLPAGPPLHVVILTHHSTIYSDSTLVLAPSEVRDFTITLPASCSLQILARDFKGGPMSGHLMIIRRPGGRELPEPIRKGTVLNYQLAIPGDGRKELSLFAGNYKAVFSPREGVQVEREFQIENDMILELEIPSSMTVQGQVRDTSGVPIVGIRVQWSEPMGTWTALTDDSGCFMLKRVQGNIGQCFVYARGKRVQVYEGSPPPELNLVLPMSTIRGRVIRPDGSPISAIVWYQPDGSESRNDWEGAPLISTRRDGTFELRVPSGRWRFQAFAEDGVGQPKPVDVDASTPGGTFEVTLTLPS